MSASIFGLITFICGAFAGFAIYHYFFRLSNQEGKLLAELNEAKAELKQYHDKVTQNLTQSAMLIDKVHTHSKELHEHILNASVALNRSTYKQSVLQPVLHLEALPDDSADEEQVTEFHPAHAEISKVKVSPPKDYV